MSVSIIGQSRSFVDVFTLACIITIVVICFLVAPSNLVSLNPVEMFAYAKRDWVRANFVSHSAECRRVFVFGNSLLAASFWPEVFDRSANFGTCSYNLAITSHDVHKSIYILRDAIRAGNIPDIVIVNLSNEVVGPIFVNGSEDEYFSTFPMKTQRDLLVQRFLGDPTLGRLLRSVRNLIRYSELQTSLNAMRDMRGVYWWGPSASLPASFSDRDDNPEKPLMPHWSKSYRAIVQEFVSEVGNIGAKLYIVEPPIRRGRASQRNCVPVEYIDLHDRYSHVMIDDSARAYVILGPEEFLDRGHVNKVGARDYSEQLGKLFRYSLLNTIETSNTAYAEKLLPCKGI